MKYYIGCSGFSYKEWKGVFYPAKLPQSKWFEFYTTRFNTLEVNISFYRFPKPAMLNNWYERSPEDFLFSLKAPRWITHYRKFKDTEQMLADFYGLVGDCLKTKLGPILFQLPKGLTYSKDLLETLTHSLHSGFSNVIEFRDSSWWTPAVEAALAKHQIIFCGISHPDLPDTFIKNQPEVYYRYHGVPRLYYSEYDPSVLEQMAKQLKPASIRHAYIYFNNTAGGAAIHNALRLQELVAK